MMVRLAAGMEWRGAVADESYYEFRSPVGALGVDLKTASIYAVTDAGLPLLDAHGEIRRFRKFHTAAAALVAASIRGAA